MPNRSGERARDARLTRRTVIRLRARARAHNLSEGERARIADHYGITRASLTQALTGRTWRSLNEIAPPARPLRRWNRNPQGVRG